MALIPHAAHRLKRSVESTDYRSRVEQIPTRATLFRCRESQFRHRVTPIASRATLCPARSHRWNAPYFAGKAPYGSSVWQAIAPLPDLGGFSAAHWAGLDRADPVGVEACTDGQPGTCKQSRSARHRQRSNQMVTARQGPTRQTAGPQRAARHKPTDGKVCDILAERPQAPPERQYPQAANTPMAGVPNGLSVPAGAARSGPDRRPSSLRCSPARQDPPRVPRARSGGRLRRGGGTPQSRKP
jgi:hypothetical protein